jgi:SAM-dependent methyltransferase
VFGNAAAESQGRLAVLEACYDPFSRRQMGLTGLAAGWRCLEVGGGGGSLGDWLAERVGPRGEVTITDIDPRWAVSRDRPANVRVLRHDIVRDPLPGTDYDLVHARLVLLHLPERLEVLERLVSAVRPGGWLVLEEFDCGWVPVLAAPDERAAALFDRVHAALMGVLERAGADPLWGRRVLGAMVRSGLVDVAANTHAQAWPGCGTGIALHRHNIDQVSGELAEAGIGTCDLERFRGLLRDPAFVVNSYPLISVRGRRPGEDGAR